MRLFASAGARFCASDIIRCGQDSLGKVLVKYERYAHHQGDIAAGIISTYVGGGIFGWLTD
jgi:hypothetical protein